MIDYTENDFAMALGGGIDVNLNRQGSVTPGATGLLMTKTGVTGDFADHLRFSTGFVFKLGKR